ncbi:MAG TPA: AtpZ/AtpI family protein [Patescibacteria group bacterium]|nr:AtpZ/AtpI family protein [Patescibacteria group bacterium]
MVKAADTSTTREKSVKKPTKDPLDGWVIAMQFVDTGLRVALPILIFCYVGIRLDKHLHTSPLYTLIGLFSSLALSTFLIYKQIKSAYPDFFALMKKDRKQ